jgi:hypothetical protein
LVNDTLALKNCRRRTRWLLNETSSSREGAALAGAALEPAHPELFVNYKCARAAVTHSSTGNNIALLLSVVFALSLARF